MLLDPVLSAMKHLTTVASSAGVENKAVMWCLIYNCCIMINLCEPVLTSDLWCLCGQDYLVKQGLTTQKADALMSSVIATTDCVSYDVQLAQQFIQDQVGTDRHFLLPCSLTDWGVWCQLVHVTFPSILLHPCSSSAIFPLFISGCSWSRHTVLPF